MLSLCAAALRQLSPNRSIFAGEGCAREGDNDLKPSAEVDVPLRRSQPRFQSYTRAWNDLCIGAKAVKRAVHPLSIWMLDLECGQRAARRRLLRGMGRAMLTLDEQWKALTTRTGPARLDPRQRGGPRMIWSCALDRNARALNVQALVASR